MTGAELKIFRESKDLTQAQFAQLIGLKREKTISDYERGDLVVPDWLIKLISLLKSTKREVTMIDNGLTATSILIDYLEEHLVTNRLEGDSFLINHNAITEIENHKGVWRVCFAEVPEMSVLLILFTFFETEQNWDGLDELVFYQDKLLEKKFNNVAGCTGEGFGEKMGEIIIYAAQEARKRTAKEQADAVFQ